MGLDSFETAILRALNTNARMSHVELGDMVGLSSTAVARRQKLLEQAGLIQGYNVDVDLAALGFATTVLVRIALENQTEDALRKFEAGVLSCPSITRCLLMSGSDDYLAIVLARDIEDFERIHRTELSRLPHVSRIQSSFAMREIINRSIPPAVFGPARWV